MPNLKPFPWISCLLRAKKSGVIFSTRMVMDQTVSKNYTLIIFLQEWASYTYTLCNVATKSYNYLTIDFVKYIGIPIGISSFQRLPHWLFTILIHNWAPTKTPGRCGVWWSWGSWRQFQGDLATSIGGRVFLVLTKVETGIWKGEYFQMFLLYTCRIIVSLDMFSFCSFFWKCFFFF